MVEAVINHSTRRLLLALELALLAFPGAARAHRLDEYLQATLVDLQPGEIRLQINLTPGVAVAEQLLATIDRDHDGTISPSESRDYTDLLRRDLDLRLDDRSLGLTLTASTLPPPDELRTGFEIIQVEFTASPGQFAGGSHELTLLNRHLPAMSVYLFNAAQPRFATITVTAQKRNPSQSIGKITFTFQPPASPHPSSRGIVPRFWPAGLFFLLAAATALWQWKKLPPGTQATLASASVPRKTR